MANANNFVRSCETLFSFRLAIPDEGKLSISFRYSSMGNTFISVGVDGASSSVLACRNEEKQCIIASSYECKTSFPSVSCSSDYNAFCT